MNSFNEEYVENLPDYYAKSEKSNNYKLLKIAEYSTERFRDCLNTLDEALNISKANGAVLDSYGELVGQPRGETTDEQYLLLIKAKIMRNLSNSTYESVVKSLSTILNCECSEIEIKDADDAYTIEIPELPLDTVLKADFTVSQFNALLKSILPVGIKCDVNYSGTFEFAADESTSDYDEITGFSNDDATIGGYFGALSADDSATELPI